MGGCISRQHTADGSPAVVSVKDAPDNGCLAKVNSTVCIEKLSYIWFLQSADVEPSLFDFGTEDKPIKFCEIEETLSTGDLAVLYRGENRIPHFAVFIKHGNCSSSNFPLLLLKGKTKPLPLHKFNPKISRDAHTVSATSRIFYGDYRKAAVHQLNTTQKFKCQEVMELIKELASISFSEQEVMAVKEASTSEERSAMLCTFMVAHFYKLLGELKEHDPHTITPQDLVCKLPLSTPTYIKLPKVKEGPLATGDPPFIARIV